MKTIPDTPIINEALSIVKAALSKNIFNHSMRTFHLGSEYAEKYNRRFSKEELLLVALFHDIGLYSPYNIKGKPFQIASSAVLKEYLLTRKGIHPDRINAMMEAIDYHFQLSPRWDKGEIAGLLQIGAHMDVIGKNSHSIEKNKRNDILAKFPKSKFILEFNICLLKSFTGYNSIKGLFYPESFCRHNHYI